MKIYFLTIAVVHSAALLAGKALKDQYAYLGAMAKHIGMDPGEMPDVDGIPEVPVKAQSFRFGIRCGDIIRNYYPENDDEKAAYCDAEIARLFFTTLPSEGLTGEEAKTAKAFFEQAFWALIKRSQIKTHTNKPGFENIDLWLERFYRLQDELYLKIPAFCDILVTPDPEKRKQYTDGLISPSDPLTSLALTDSPVSRQTVLKAVNQSGGAAFEQILREILVGEQTLREAL